MVLKAKRTGRLKRVRPTLMLWVGCRDNRPVIKTANPLIRTTPRACMNSTATSHLTHRIEALVCVVANVAGDLTRIEEVRRLGQAH